MMDFMFGVFIGLLALVYIGAGVFCYWWVLKSLKDKDGK